MKTYHRPPSQPCLSSANTLSLKHRITLSYHTLLAENLSRASDTLKYTMVVSNIHHPRQVFERGIAIIQPNIAHVQRVHLNCSQENIDDFSQILRVGILNEWFQTCSATDGKPYEARADDRVHIPSILVSLPFQLLSADLHQLDRLDYVYVVQGKNDGRCFKVRVAHTIDEAAQDMLNEVMNGYSITFAGAILKTVSRALFPGTLLVNPRVQFTQVALGHYVPRPQTSLAPLESATEMSADGQTLTKVGIWC